MKCPVCDWEIKDAGITVTDRGRQTVVCCEECADKLAKDTKGPKPR